MTSLMIARLALVAAAGALLIVGIAGILRAEWWGVLESVGAVVMLSGMALTASGAFSPGRPTRADVMWSRRRQRR
jgi:hypothetical protein